MFSAWWPYARSSSVEDMLMVSSALWGGVGGRAAGETDVGVRDARGGDDEIDDRGALGGGVIIFPIFVL